jgi:lipopolysaccharide export system protein LptA
VKRFCPEKRPRESVAATICLWIVVATAMAAPALAADGDKPADPVYITAEHLTADTAGRWAEFSGKVNAKQGETVITADRLKVVYARQASAGGSKQSTSQIERIEAAGKVVIRFDQRVAESREASYSVADRTLVLTGDPARVTEGENTVSGGRIVMKRNENRIIVEKPASGNVEAVFFTDDREAPVSPGRPAIP